MTQSGQGDEPSARPAHEGIVLPSDGGEPLLPGMTGTPAVPPGGQPWGGSWGPGQDQQQPYHQQDQHQQGQHQQHQQGQGWPPAAAQEWQAPEQPSGPGPMPPEGPAYDAQGYGGAQPYPQQHQGYGYPQPQQAAPLPPMDEAATQFMPPVGPGAGQGPEGATQYLPPVPSGGADQAATQYIPPVASGALPPEATGGDGRQGYPQQQPADEAATQYIPPYQGGGDDRQPPAEFDNLFRGAPYGADAAQGSTQQMPRVPAPDPRPPAPMVSAQPAYRPPMDHDDGGRRGGGRTGSRVPLIAAVGVGIVVLGIGAGALLSGGGDDGDSRPVASSSTPSDEKPSPSASAADPAQPQAAELDKLLADSGNSRSAVIQSVERIKQCQNLDQAASDLHGAAKQRADLVSRLGKLSVDKLPDSGELNAALTAAWQASAAADNHYAVWARQAKSKKVCVKGHARSTNHSQAGNAQSGTASAQKAKAAQLWNAIATKYGLTTRQPTQL
ncbi:hypothetical protein ABZX97_03940 [Streptomyces seoulensis]|uniref:hypothetical protein n=1 Tax=Streptomyces seoulensis TaxID=73044 RepID=UPI0033BBA11D